MKHSAAVVVEKSLGESAFGEDDIVRLKLDVKIFHLAGSIGLHDRDPVDEVFRFDQDAGEEHCVMRRDPEVATGHIVFKRTGFDADRQNILAAKDEASAIASPPDPNDRTHLAGSGHDLVADHQILDRDIATHGADQAAAAEARRVGND